MPSSDADSQPSNRTSLSLLERAKSDDQEAWRRIVQLYGPLVYNWCRRAGLSPDDMSDVFQEVFRAVSQGLGKFEPRKEIGSFRSWLRTVARSKIANHFNRAGRNPKAAGGTDANVRFAEVPDPLDEDSEVEVESDQSILVRQALDLIRPDFSENSWHAFSKVAIDGRDVHDIASELDMTDQAVRQAIYRIRRRLRQELEGLFDWPTAE